MWTQGAITHQTLLEILQRGETLPDIDIEGEIELLEAGKLRELDIQAAGGLPTEDEADEGNDANQSNSGSEQEVPTSSLAVRRLLANLEANSEEDDK